METLVETSVWRVECNSVDKKALEAASKEILALGFDDVAATSADEEGMVIFVRRCITASDEVDYATIEEPLLQLRSCIIDQFWVDELLDAEVRHDIIGLDIERMQVVTKQYHFDVTDEEVDAITSL